MRRYEGRETGSGLQLALKWARIGQKHLFDLDYSRIYDRHLGLNPTLDNPPAHPRGLCLRPQSSMTFPSMLQGFEHRAPV
jgi:hypothetical protein